MTVLMFMPAAHPVNVVALVLVVALLVGIPLFAFGVELYIERVIDAEFRRIDEHRTAASRGTPRDQRHGSEKAAEEHTVYGPSVENLPPGRSRVDRPGDRPEGGQVSEVRKDPPEEGSG